MRHLGKVMYRNVPEVRILLLPRKYVSQRLRKHSSSNVNHLVGRGLARAKAMAHTLVGIRMARSLFAKQIRRNSLVGSIPTPTA